MARNLRQVDRDDEVRSLTADLVWNVGLFYDRQGSLLASLLFSGSRAYKTRINLYPGFVRCGDRLPAFFAAVGRRNEIIFGISLRRLPLGITMEL